MAEVPITINGVICDLYGRTITGPIKIVGSLMKSGVSVGGGPIIPPEGGPPGGGGPPSIWPGPGDPDFPGGGGPPPTPSDPTVVKPPPPEGGWGYSPDLGWGYYPGPGQPEPKK